MLATFSAPRSPASGLARRRSSSVAIWAATAGRSCPTRRPWSSADVLLVEATYGDRLHETDDDGPRLAAIVNDTLERKGG